MSVIDTMVYDRADTDVARLEELREKWLNGSITAEEKAEWLARLKGALNYTDINRIRSAINYVTDTLHSLGYTISTSGIPSYSEGNTPTKAELEQLASVLNTLKNIFTIPSAKYVPENLNGLTPISANAIEKMFVEINAIDENVLKNTNVSWAMGQASSGLFASNT